MEAALRLENHPVAAHEPVSPGGVPRGNGRFLQLLSVMQRAKDGRGGVFGFTSAVRGEGVSYVTNAVAVEVGVFMRERVLVSQTSVLGRLTPRDLDESAGTLREISGQVWSVNAATLPPRHAGPDLRPELLEAMRRKFGYVLIDCPALGAAPEILRIAPQLDGVVLVVGAGQANRTEVLHAQRVLQLASDKLLGCVLNKQKTDGPGLLGRYVEFGKGVRV